MIDKQSTRPRRRSSSGGWLVAWVVMTALFLVLALVGCGPNSDRAPAPTNAPPPVPAPATPEG